MRHLTTLLILLLTTLTQAAPLAKIENCTLIPTTWADGDSFQIQIPAKPADPNDPKKPGHKARQITLRLYGADTIETHITTDSDSRRLRAQRRYFGITTYGNDPQKSIALAKTLGNQATTATQKLLANPFTIHTAFADARGSSEHKRYYGFITTADGKDLAAQLVELGLARAYGVYRKNHKNQTADDYREHLKDLELQAAKAENGIWKHTNWKNLPTERQEARNEENELELAKDNQKPKLPNQKINPNKATRDQLMSLPGIGEAKANDIIQNRPYNAPVDLQNKVKGIGPATLKKLLPHLTLPNQNTPT